jgi:glycosyltransferase involved in cell wall biosynthesis
LQILNDDEVRRAMGQAGRRRAVERFDAKKIVPQYEEIYYRMLDRVALEYQI